MRFIVLAFAAITVAVTAVVGQQPQACVAPYNSYPFCDTKLPLDQRVSNLLSLLNVTEKIQQTTNTAAAIPRLGIPAYQWWSEALHGVNSNCDSSGRCPTSFPSALGMGASFNDALWYRVGSVISDELHALRAELVTEFLGQWLGLDVWTPNINIFRDPRWGRGQETPGEDPVLSGRYGTGYVRGLQFGDDKRYLKASATLKHFDAYSLENSDGTDRFHFNAVVSEQDLHQTYYPAFKTTVERGQAMGFMCSYNSVNGIPACASPELFNEMRLSWGFAGYVTSDCDAIDCIVSTHNYTSSYPEAVAMAVKAGCDVDCGETYPNHMQDSLDAGLMSESDLDTILGRLFSLRMKLGMFDPLADQPYNQIPPTVIDSTEHRQLARQVARESIVLLKNDNGLLPIDTPAKIALIGPNSNATYALCSNYFGQLPHVVSPQEGLNNVDGLTVNWQRGCNINDSNTDGFTAAVEAALVADYAIFVGGIDNSIESEGRDRVSIDLPEIQLQLLQQIMAVQPNTILVLVGGSSLDISWAAQHVPAIVNAFYPGEEGGNALADILTGLYNPSGRLPITIYPASFVNVMSMGNMNMRDAPGKTYRFYTDTPVYPFGFGLSYTTFGYEIVGGSIGGASYMYNVTVTNTGSVAGDVSVLGFLSKVSNSDSSVSAIGATGATDAPDSRYVDTDCPISQLFDWQKINLWPGASQVLSFQFSALDAGCYDSNGQRAVKSGTYTITLGDAMASFNVSS